ncbi:MAG: glycosyltransferase family 39 protein, partial [Candidatus Levybacteria bacterium]|nr:glycosyltransferase family 39 protein [Candidatus Levybacteria bacterium]
MKKIFLILVLIFLFGFILRFYNLGIFPGSLHRDEAFLGYNAYSILSTGKDMSAKLLPLHLESFIYSPAGYSYFTIPFILLFDLSEFSVRSASAFFGALSILALYFLVKELFKRDNLALLSAFFLAISPWHINLSRTATENVIVVFFLLLGILFFVKYLRKGYKYLFISFLCFSITILLYQAPRAFLPIFIPFLIFVFIDRKKIIKDKFILGFLYLFLIVLPVIYILSSADLSLRIKSLSIFENSNTQLLLTEQITNDGKYGLPYVATRVFHNKIIANLLMFSENYSKHFTFDFLFLDKGFPDRYRVPQMGLLYVHELPLILSGLFIMLKKQRRVGLFLLGWLLISPIGSALASDDVPNL